MWYLKIISGPGTGNVMPLKMGTNVIGRSNGCDITLPSSSVSKEHARLEVYNDKIIITDLRSRNGTFINGIQVQSQKVRVGDKLSFFDIVAEIFQQTQVTAQIHHSHDMYDGNAAYKQNPHEPSPESSKATTEPTLIAYLKKYIDEVVLPGVYKLIEWFEFRWVIGMFVAGFIVFVTALSTIPLIRILKSSIEQESQNRALTIAKTIAELNRTSISQGLFSTVSVEFANKEPGVKNAYIVRGDNGQIIAPAQFLNEVITNIPSVATALKFNSQHIKQIDSSTIVAMFPISFSNPTTGAPVVAAFSVVLYDMDRLAVDNQTTLSLFVQVLFIALILGGILFFFLQSIIEYPFLDLNKQLSAGLQSGHVQLQTNFQFPILHQLVTNINSAVNRANSGFSDQKIGKFEADRSAEINGLLTLIGFPALAVQPAQRLILNANELFVAQIGSTGQWMGMPVDQIMDQALKLNINGLLERVAASPGVSVSDQLEVNNVYYDIIAQSVMGSDDIAYVVIVFLPRSG